MGRLSNEQFALLTSGYAALTKRAAELRQEIDTAAERGADVKRFVALVRRYSEISELTYENVLEFIGRILVHELNRETNTRKIEIFYSHRERKALLLAIPCSYWHSWSTMIRCPR